ncbi:MAG: heparin lyase I family protein [Verrucomicrobiaceae bacterium]|nr:heparin lyase I family protein [Verrucomicrobiaceae bacterium]
MKLKRLLLIIVAAIVITLAILLAGHLDWFKPAPFRNETAFTFRDGFEDAGTFLDLYPKNLSRWHGWQLVPAQNKNELTSEVVHSGRQALKCFASAKRNDVTSKADVLREQLRFVKGDHVWSECWFLLQGGASAENVFLWDLESSTKWQSPGRRVYLEKGNVIASDLGKWFTSSVFRQAPDHALRFPLDRWVRLRVHLFLSEQSDGVMEVWQDDAKVIDARGQTLPTAKTIYDRLEVGLTANGSTEHAHTLYVDDVTISNRAFW